MNILPKKRWHVRTRENIARVRRDEAQAAEEEKKKQERIFLAEKEARTDVLRTKARLTSGYIPPEKPKKDLKEEAEGFSKGHINFFYELERNEIVSTKTNVDHEKEVKEEREKEEMKIGYLTYLGQDTNELTGNVSWYNKLPAKSNDDVTEVGLKEKLRADPLKDIRKYLGTEGVRDILKPKPTTSSHKGNDSKNKERHRSRKHKKHKKNKRKRHSISSDDEQEVKKVKTTVDVEKLRQERLMREKVEQQKAAAVLARLQGIPEDTSKATSQPPLEYVQKYSSQFNPHIARQNFL